MILFIQDHDKRHKIELNMNIKKLFYNFIGAWQIRRILGNDGVAEGLAKFILQFKDCIIYQEEIKVKFNNSKMTQNAYKEYIYFYDSKNDNIIKKFIDDTEFYYLNFESNNQKAYGKHLCKKDTYKATYDFLSENNFTLKYGVSGPSKDYTIYTEYFLFTKLK